MTDIYVKTPDMQSFMADLKMLHEGFVREDEEGNEVLNAFTHKWSIDWIGDMVKTKAEFDEDGNVTAEATYWEGKRANIRLHDHDFEQEFTQLLDSGQLDEMPNGSQFLRPQPQTPDRIFA